MQPSTSELRRALVVGGSGGVGSAIAEALAAAGHDLALTWCRSATRAETVAARIRATGCAVSLHRHDLVDGDACALMAEVGEVDALVYAAGPALTLQWVATVSAADWAHALAVDAQGFLALVQAALPGLRSRRGALVAVSTAGLRRHPPGDILSVGPKAVVEALVRGVAREEGRHGVRANAVALGVIDAGMFPELVASGELSESWVKDALHHTALKRFGTATEVAQVVAWLVSAQASYVTGQVLNLDGGATL